MTKKLYIFHPEFDVSTVLPKSTLLTSIDQPMTNNEYHTSLGDMSSDNIILVAKHFLEIEFINVGFDFDSAIWHETKALLNYLSHKYRVLNFCSEIPKTFTNISTNQDNNKKIWIFGCSHSHGVGLDSENQRFGSIVSDQLALPAVFVTQPGSSLQWSLRHLINTDFGPQDVVIWQITTPHRLTIFNRTSREVLLSNTQNRYLLEVFNDQQIFFHHCSLINYGVRYLRSNKTNFVMISLLDQQKLFYHYIDEYTKYPEYCYMPTINLDLGNDHLHYGPLSHRAIANRLVDHIQCKDE